jgi:tetraacyldisaccharide 4'-kinase
MFDLKKKVETIIKRNDPAGVFSAETGLYALSRIYEKMVQARGYLYKSKIVTGKRLPKKTISVGNLTVGGTGKTPMCIYLASWLKKEGFQPAIVSRGYRGRAESGGGVVGDGEKIRMTSDEAGDEPVMMAEILRVSGVPVLVGKDRFRSGMEAIRRFGADVIILDDGFQHVKLERDIDLVLLDYVNPLGNGFLLPRGPLREPVSALSRGDAFVFTRSGENATAPESIGLAGNKPLFSTRHRSYLYSVIRPERETADIRSEYGLMDVATGNCSVLSFSAIAENGNFEKDLRQLQLDVREHRGFSDHYFYRLKDLEDIDEASRRLNVDYLATTHKDWVRFSGMYFFSVPLLVFGVSIEFVENEKGFQRFILEKMKNGED